ncbi:MAG: GntR family transcriptional regulator [Actinomycetota bacterium]
MAQNTLGSDLDVAGRVRRDVPIPYYAQLARIIEREITDGRRHPGDVLPSEAELCEVHGVSRTAVRQALGELAARGLVRKQKGRRTSVARAHMTNIVVQELRGFFDEVSSHGSNVKTRVLQQSIVPAPPDVAADLGLVQGADALLLARVREVDGEPVVYVETHLPVPRFAALAGRDLTDVSLYAVLGADFDVHPRSGARAIEAAVADGSLARHLGVRKGSAMLSLWAVNRDQHGVPFERFHAWYRGDGTRFELVVGS